MLVDLLYYNIDKEIFCEKHFREKSLKNLTLSNENLNFTNPESKTQKNKQNVYHSFKQTKQPEKISSIVCAGCDMVRMEFLFLIEISKTKIYNHLMDIVYKFKSVYIRRK